MREVFLSHASQDHKQAAALRALLLAHSIPVWFSPHHIRGGRQWQQEIGRALDRCGWFMVLITPYSVKSMWVRREVQYALSSRRLESRIVPVLFKKCNTKELSWALPQMQVIDFTKNYERACQDLLRIWKKRFRANVLKD